MFISREENKREKEKKEKKKERQELGECEEGGGSRSDQVGRHHDLTISGRRIHYG